MGSDLPMVPRKMGLNWFMPALVKRSVGSLWGTTEPEGTAEKGQHAQQKMRTVAPRHQGPRPNATERDASGLALSLAARGR